MTDDDLEVFRNMAKQSRKAAASMSDLQIKNSLELIAREFDLIAVRTGSLRDVRHH